MPSIKSIRTYSEEWWESIMEGQAEPAFAFNEDTLVFSEMAVRAIVVKAIKDFQTTE